MFRSVLRVGLICVCGLTCASAGAETTAPFQLPDTTPAGKPHFDSKGAKVGDQLPNFPMLSLDGKPISLGEAWSGGTTLLLTSSYTCPKSRATYPQAADLARRISGRGVRVAIVYVIEAHPAGDPSPYTGVEEVTTENRRDQILCHQPKTPADRLKLANDFAKRLNVVAPIFVDAMDNAAWSTLGGGPNMGVLVDADGIVIARQGWFDAKSMEAAISALVAVPPKAPKPTERDEASSTIDSTLLALIDSDKSEALKAVLDQQPNLAKRRLESFRGQSLLQEAAYRGNLIAVKLLVERGASLNDETPTESTPLHQAVENGKVEVAQFLLEHGADINAKELGHGPTPLQEALLHKQPEMAAVLIKAGAKPNFYTEAATGDLAGLQRDYLQDMTVLSRPDGRGRSALVYAAATGHIDSAKLLISLGARDFPADRDDREAAEWAVREKNLQMTRLLLDAGSNPNLFSSAMGVDIPVDFVRALLEHKPDLNYVAERGLRPLHLAAAYDLTNVMQLLLDAGADINATTTEGSMLFCGPLFQKGDTPLHVAAENGFLSSAEFLVRHGAKVNVRNADGQTPLHFAAASHFPKVAEPMTRILIEHHADVNALDAAGGTPLDYNDAADRDIFRREDESRARITELLRKNGAIQGNVTELEAPESGLFGDQK
ncbi:MAG TPA: ankyrin repeat domain-containing protein [Tepidisphaeraceae bacterium]|jgi:ankyrin repeat protein|nr:ankyrin repeat domain-containing protein [Tepidisphaeraceae bacterium]